MVMNRRHEFTATQAESVRSDGLHILLLSNGEHNGAYIKLMRKMGAESTDESLVAEYVVDEDGGYEAIDAVRSQRERFEVDFVDLLGLGLEVSGIDVVLDLDEAAMATLATGIANVCP
jgi:hypothetical protein